MSVQFSINLKRIMNDSRLSAREIARRSGLTSSTISRIYANKTKIIHDITKAKIASVFNIDVKEFEKEDFSINANENGQYKIFFRNWKNKSLDSFLLLSTEYYFALQAENNNYNPPYEKDSVLLFINDRPFEKDIVAYIHHDKLELFIVDSSQRIESKLKSLYTNDIITVKTSRINMILSKSIHMG